MRQRGKIIPACPTNRKSEKTRKNIKLMFCGK